ncbi:MAG TPA: hypothetical protein VFK92_04375 [Burkholderiales bacterium]|nr:hypothetical protein [Burkholderiales bacterium]
MKNHLDHQALGNLRALELAAHRARGVELARLFRSGAAALKALIERLLAATHGGRKVGHA